MSAAPEILMKHAEEYKGEAAKCALLAQRVAGLYDKALWFVMAEAWLHLADDAAGLGSIFAKSEESSVKLPEMTRPPT